MAKRVFFSFHYNDVIDFRANTVRNHWLTKKNREAAGFFDASIWENAKKDSIMALKRLINNGIKNTSNTCVLIGSETTNRRWVKYEIFKSMEAGNHIFGVHINKIKGKDQKTKNYGINPFENLGYHYSNDGKRIHPIEYKNSKWIFYKDFNSYLLSRPAPRNKCGKSFQLSSDYKTYCWNKDDGYNNFSNWVK